MNKQDTDARIMEFELRLSLAEQQLNKHEKECSERYKTLDSTMSETKGIVTEVRDIMSQARGGLKAFLIIGGLITLIVTVLKLGHAL